MVQEWYFHFLFKIIQDSLAESAICGGGALEMELESVGNDCSTFF